MEFSKSQTARTSTSYIFKTFVLSFQRLNHLNDPLLFKVYLRPPLEPLRTQFEGNPFLRALLSPLECSPV